MIDDFLLVNSYNPRKGDNNEKKTYVCRFVPSWLSNHGDNRYAYRS